MMNKWDSFWLGSNTCVAVKDGRIVWLGDIHSLDASPEILAKTVIDHKDKYITPGLVDCHTHLIYGGTRASEFERRLKGESYASIAESGGGIRSTVTATRASSFEALYALATPRVLSMMRQGVTTIEIKSGYGLDLETELKMLRVAKQLGSDLNVEIIATFLGAHTIPEEYRSRVEAYVDFLCDDVMPAVKEQALADTVDIFCESIAFNLEQTQKVLSKALFLGFKIKCHAEQLSLLGASEWAASKGALSCDHLEYIDNKAIQAMADHETVAVLLPGAYYFLSEKKKPPVSAFREAGVPMAIATDCNPGSSPTTSLQLMMSMACVQFGLTVEEAWLGVTRNAAQALGLSDRGSLTVGHRADLCLWPRSAYADIAYCFGEPVLPLVVYDGILRT